MEKVSIYINKEIGKVTAYARSRDTRSGFAHDCVIPELNIKVKAIYYNRTWESFQYQSVIHSALDKVVKDTLGLKGKKNEKAASRVYKTLVKRVDHLHDKGKFKYVPSEYCIFG